MSGLFYTIYTFSYENKSQVLNRFGDFRFLSQVA